MKEISRSTEPQRWFVRSLNCLLGSTAVLTVLVLCGADMALTAIKPLRYLNASGFTPLDQNPLVCKLPEFMHSTENPDILLLGSSLALVPAVRCDDQLHGVRARYDAAYRRNHINCYSKADCLELELKNQLGKELHIRNLGVIASMFSDHELILDRALKSGKKPQLIICCIAPRDFLDNYRSVVEQTPVFQVLAELSDVQSLSESGSDWRVNLSRGVERLWHFYMVRSDYQTVAVAATANFLHHPVSLYQATNGASPKGASSDNNQQDIEIGILDQRNKPDYQKQPNTLADLETYRHVYQPVNNQLFKTQTKYLQKFLEICREKEIPTVIVDMPLTEANRALLPKTAWTKYQDTVKSLTEKYGADYFDAAETTQFSLDDFEDSCHLNETGGKKFYEILAAHIGKNKLNHTLAAKKDGPL